VIVANLLVDLAYAALDGEQAAGSRTSISSLRPNRPSHLPLPSRPSTTTMTRSVTAERQATPAAANHGAVVWCPADRLDGPGAVELS
jgi:hypothetical protein